jgi:tetratricopeptide (TPR) repeat protein
VNFEDNKAKRDQLYSEAEVDLWSALNAVERLVDADGESWWGALGGLYKRQDRFDEALKCYRRAAQTTPTSSYPAINQALLELKQGDDHYSDSFKRVAKLAQREINADPDNYWPYGDLVIAELVLNRVDDAATCYEELLLLIPKKVTDVLPRVHDTLNDIADDLRARNRVEQADAIEKFMNERLAR